MCIYNLRTQLREVKEGKQCFESMMKGKLWLDDDHAKLQGLEEDIQKHEAKLREVGDALEKRLAQEVVEDENLQAGNFVPKKWGEFYGNVEKRVSHFLDMLFEEPAGVTQAEREQREQQEAIEAEARNREITTRVAGERKKRKAESDAQLETIGFGKERFDEKGNLKSYSFEIPKRG